MSSNGHHLIDNIVLWVTEDCNLQCSYCFVKKNHRHISPAVTEQLIGFFRNTLGLFDKQVIVNFTGGEPLLQFGTIRTIVELLNGHRSSFPFHLSFGIITNGTLLTPDITDYLVQHRFAVMLSLDGTPETMEQQRKHNNGVSYPIDTVKEAIQQLKHHNIRLRARLTFTPHSLNLAENVDYLVSMGLDDITLVPDMEETWDGLEIELQNALFSLGIYYLQAIEQERHFKLTPFDDFLARYHRFKYSSAPRQGFPCSSGRSTLGVNVDGDIYPCHHWHNQDNRTLGIGKPESHRLGSLSEGIVTEKRCVFTGYSSDVITACARCPGNYLCGGPCYATSHLYYNDLYEVFSGQCIYMRSCTPVIQYLYSKLKYENEKVLLEILFPDITTATCCG